MVATNNGHAEIVKLLLEAKASVDTRDKVRKPHNTHCSRTTGPKGVYFVPKYNMVFINIILSMLQGAFCVQLHC